MQQFYKRAPATLWTLAGLVEECLLRATYGCYDQTVDTSVHGTMKEPTKSTLKRLFAMSRNCCAFTECTLPIFEDSGALTGTVCHIEARSAAGPRYNPLQSDNARHGYQNLILLCARHSKIIDSDPKHFTVAMLSAMKIAHENRKGVVEITTSDATKADALLEGYRITYNVSAAGHVMINSPGAVQANNVIVRGRNKSVKAVPSPGSIGANVVHRNYVKYLIDRYNDFASKQDGRIFAFAVIYRSIKSEFKADWERIPLACFDKLVAYLQRRINATRLGRINRAGGNKNYSTFDEYIAEYSGQPSAGA